MKHVIVGTAGHIDHGKSTLVEALTGTHPDRLEEEKRRGITIDLGFAFLALDDVRFGIVDVPGHQRFVGNMLSGAGGIDLVLLVVAADESIKPQTREHFDICRLLGIRRGIVVLTKADLVEPDTLSLVRLEVEEFLRGSFLEGAPIVPVCARTGEGIGLLKTALLGVAREVPSKDAGHHFRLPIDRAFAMKGFGTVVTGTLVSGSVAPEDEVELFPARRRLRVRGVQSGEKAVSRAFAGQRTAVNLASVDLAEVHRGMVLAAPGRFESTRRLDARISLLSSARRMRNRTRVHFHQGTADTIAEVILLDCAELAPGESAFAQLRLDDPALILPGDRFILRQFSPVVTIGGGVAVDVLAPRHRLRDTGVIPFLQTLERGTRAEVLVALAGVSPHGLELSQIASRTGWLKEEITETVRGLAQQGEIRVVSEQPLVIVSRQRFADCVARIRAQVEAFHGDQPLLAGIPKENLRARAAASVFPEVFSTALNQLAAENWLTLAGDTVQRAGRAVPLQADEALAKKQIENAFARSGLIVPVIKEVLAGLPVEPRRAEKLLQLLLREQVLVKVADNLVFHCDALTRMRELLADYKKKNGDRLAIAAFKDLTGITRKYAIPLLEYLDRTRVTRRVGDERIIL